MIAKNALATQGRRPAPLPLDGPFPIDRQEALGRRLMARFGFDFAAPIIRAVLDLDCNACSVANPHAHGLRVDRGFIRVDADAVTYPAHVILRYRLERALIADDLARPDLPSA